MVLEMKVPHVSGGVLWANLHLLFWLSLIPFVTGWMGENHFAAAPTALYGVVLLMSALAYWALQRCLLRSQGDDSPLARAIGKDLKGKISMALMWLVPDSRIERALGAAASEPEGA